MLLAVIAFAPGPVAAGTVQKCVDTAGHVTLTSGDCGAGERLVARYDAAPEPVPAAAPAAATPVPEATRRPRAASRASRGSASRSRTRPDACQAARARRDRTLQRVGLKRTFDLLRKLDDDVWNACR